MAQDIILEADFLSPNSIFCRGATVNYGFSPLTRTTPLNNAYELAETQTSGFENPKITITGYINTNNLSSTDIQHKHLLTLSKNKYDGSEGKSIYLTIKTGTEDEPLYAINGVTDTIKVVVEGFNIVMDTGSDLAHFWSYTLNLVETK